MKNEITTLAQAIDYAVKRIETHHGEVFATSEALRKGVEAICEVLGPKRSSQELLTSFVSAREAGLSELNRENTLDSLSQWFVDFVEHCFVYNLVNLRVVGQERVKAPFIVKIPGLVRVPDLDKPEYWAYAKTSGPDDVLVMLSSSNCPGAGKREYEQPVADAEWMTVSVKWYEGDDHDEQRFFQLDFEVIDSDGIEDMVEASVNQFHKWLDKNTDGITILPC